MHQSDTLDQDWHWSWLNGSDVGQTGSVRADLEIVKTYKDTLHNWWFTPTYTDVLVFTVRKEHLLKGRLKLETRFQANPKILQEHKILISYWQLTTLFSYLLTMT